jgi:hypothetical protein
LAERLYKAFWAAHGDSLALRFDRNRLRILAYHGICKDRIAAERWLPSHFVTRSAFESQLAYLKCRAQVFHLEHAIACMKAGDLPKRCVAITFDDGYANNLEIAYPLLRRHRIPATNFLATHNVESGDFFPTDKIRLIRFVEGRESDAAEAIRGYWMGYDKDPLVKVLQRVEREWGRAAPKIPRDQSTTLRPLLIDELKCFDPDLVQFGAHSRNHAVLKNESLAGC